MHDPDWWAFNNDDGKLERCDMKQFNADLDAAIRYQKECEEMKREQLAWFKSFDETYSVINKDTKAIVAEGLTKEVAVQIVTAVNSFESLVDAVRFALTTPGMIKGRDKLEAAWAVKMQITPFPSLKNIGSFLAPRQTVEFIWCFGCT